MEEGGLLKEYEYLKTPFKNRRRRTGLRQRGRKP